MRDLPGGTVTFFFSDIEASTRIAASLGERFADVLGEHRALVRAAFAEHDGAEISTEGDSFFAVFARAGDAVRAAAAIQRALAAHAWPAGGEVRVRIGLHTGQAVRIGHDFVGIDVNRAARVAAAGHGGQVLVSATARSAVLESGDGLPGGLALDDLGRHRLKDVGPERLWQLVGEGLPSGFGPLRSLESHPSNLPLELSSLVDREDERAALAALVLDTGLVSVTGPGGIGKSRLAVRVARDLVARFPDGVFHLDLAPLERAAGVTAALADLLGVRPPDEGPLMAALLGHLRDRELLVVLETADRVADIAALVGAVAANCPRTRLLVTSRSPLHAAAEREFPVRPLPANAAVTLFVERARALRPDFAPTGAEAAAVAEICARLDGLPLAIELAAARIRLLGPVALLERLANRLPLLAGGARDAPDRQRTLRDTIAWSYELLGPDEQAMLGRLAVFSGPFDLAAAEGVADGALAELDALECLARLVDRSLVSTVEGGGADGVDGTAGPGTARPGTAGPGTAGDGRFRLLETIREFALERLAATGELPAGRDAHARHWLSVARAALPALEGPDDLLVLAAAMRSRDEYRAALGWWLDDGGPSAPDPTRDRHAEALELAAYLGRAWWLHGQAREGIDWLERALEAAPDAPPAIRARALFWAGVLLDDLRDAPRAAERLEQSLALRRSLSDEAGVARTLNSLGVVARSLGDLDRAEALLTESLERKRALGDTPGMATTLSNLGLVAYDRGRLEDAIGLLREALRIDAASGVRAAAASSLVNLAGLLIEAGRRDDGLARLREALPVVTELADPELVAEVLEHLAGAALTAGQATGAAGDSAGDSAGDGAGAAGDAAPHPAADPAAVARMVFTAEVLRERQGVRLRDAERTRLDRALLAATARLDLATVERLTAEAQAMDLDAALALASGTLAGALVGTTGA